MALVKAAASAAADFQERFAAEDTEARKIVDIMERFLRVKGRVVYGGAAINAHLSPANKFYDPRLYLPDYDFMTPDPLQDCADLLVTFQHEGFVDVEAKFGIHEGTYKIFVNYRTAADITYMPPDIYRRLSKDAAVIEGVHYASVDFLRMNMYLELSRPAGMVSRWEKVYQRLLLLNSEHPMKAGRCPVDPLAPSKKGGDPVLHDRIVGVGISRNAIFLSGVSYLDDASPSPAETVLLVTDKPSVLVAELTGLGLRAKAFEPKGELLPARTELHTRGGSLVAVVFETVACHSYVTLKDPPGYRLGSLDFLIQMYYAFFFSDLQEYLQGRLLCVIEALINRESAGRKAASKKGDPQDVFPLECIGHQPSMPELKKAHRLRVKEKRKVVRSLRKSK